MPVPVWDCSDMSLLDEPLDTVLSDDIWKKFDLDEPLDALYVHGHQGSTIYSNGNINNNINNNNNNGGAMSEKTITAMTMMMSNIHNYDDSGTGQAISLPDFYDKLSCHGSREIRHHDCMWAGLCISKEHNRTLPAMKDSHVQSKKVPAGRSLLISSRSSSTTNCPTSQQQTTMYHHHHHQQQQNFYDTRRKDSLESDGDSARPETPQSSESETDSDDDDNEDDDDDEEEDEEEKQQEMETNESRNKINKPIVKKQQSTKIDNSVPLVFKHDQISINEKLNECMSDDTTNVRAVHVSEVTGQLVRKYYHQRQTINDETTQNRHVKIDNDDKRNVKIEHDDHCNRQVKNDIDDNRHRHNEQQHVSVKNEPDSWNTLSDHCYHQPSSKKLEHLGVQTPSDSEEEIDVVTFEKPCRPAVLPTYPSIAEQQHFQLTVNSALKEKPVTAPRPRGRPPSSGTPRKRGAQQDQKPAKRARHRTYQRRSKVTKSGPPTPASSPQKTTTTSAAAAATTTTTSSTSGSSTSPSSSSMSVSTSRSGSSDDEPDTEKRSLHNNMERQRRIELRNAFEELRVLVPEVEAKEKAPKVAILRQAAVYCDMLTEIGQVTVARVAEMKRRQERLRARLSQLRRSLAMTR